MGYSRLQNEALACPRRLHGGEAATPLTRTCGRLAEAKELAQNATAGFVRTYGVGVCRGAYSGALAAEWAAWDAKHGSENDPVDAFGPEQLHVVFVVANGGADLERFEVHGFDEARSILLQVRGLWCALDSRMQHAWWFCCENSEQI